MDPNDITGLIDVLILVIVAMIGAIVGMISGRSVAAPLWSVDADDPNQHQPSDAAYEPIR